MEIFIQRGGLQLGPPYSVEEARTYLADGLLQPDDLAWIEGMKEWVPLSNVLTQHGSKATHAMPPSLLKPAQPKVGARELGLACFDLAMGFQESYTSLIHDLQNSDTEGQVLNFGQIWIELICLGIFTVEYAMRDTMKAGPVEAVIDAYNGQVRRLSLDEVPNFFEVVSNRYPIYESAIHARHPHGIAWNVGETFAIFCGNELSTRLVMTGSMLFDKIYQYVHQWVHEIGVENITD